MDKERIKKAIESIVKEVEFEYQQTQGFILTENDLKSIIFHKLILKEPSLFTPNQSEDRNIYATMLHTELSWYDKNGKLTIKPDITILDTKYLSILHKNDDLVNLPSKGYSFNGDAVLMELKFIKNKTGISKRTIDGLLMDDIRKIQRLYSRLKEQGASYQIFCYFIVFNKTDIKCDEFLDFVTENQTENYKVIYATGKVDF